MKCLNAAIALEPSNPKVHERTVQFRHVVGPELASLDKTTAEVLKSEFPSLTEGTDALKKFNDEYLERNKADPRAVHAGIRARRMLGADGLECEKRLVGLVGAAGMEVRDGVEVLRTVEGWKSGGVEVFKERAGERWAEASAFE